MTGNFPAAKCNMFPIVTGPIFAQGRQHVSDAFTTISEKVSRQTQTTSTCMKNTRHRSNEQDRSYKLEKETPIGNGCFDHSKAKKIKDLI